MTSTRAIAAFSLALVALAETAVAQAPRPIRVADAIATADFVRLPRSGNDSAALISPDGRYFVLRTVRGDLAGDRVELTLIAGGLESLEAATRTRIVGRLYSRGFGDSRNPARPTVNNLGASFWIGAHELAFPWEDGGGRVQLVAIDVERGTSRWLTDHPGDIVLAGATQRGDLLFAAKPPIDPDQSLDLMRRGFVVSNPDALSLLRGNLGPSGMLDELWDLDLFIARAGQPVRRLDARLRWGSVFAPRASPDSRHTLLNIWPPRIPPSWAALPRLNMPRQIDFIGEALRDPAGWYGRQVTQLAVIDMETGQVDSLTDYPTVNPYVLAAAWSPDSRQVVFGPAFLSGSAGDRAAQGDAVIVADLRGGATALPLPDNASASRISSLEWGADDIIRIDVGGQALAFAQADGSWRQVTQSNATSVNTSGTPVEIYLREGLNDPPRAFARETATGRERLVLDPNLGLTERFTLSQVEHRRFRDARGRDWSALVYPPVNRTAGRRYPLVIQTHGHAPTDRFSLSGMGGGAPGLGPGWSIYAAQPIAALGIWVVQIEDKRTVGDRTSEPGMYADGYRAVIDTMSREGSVDPGLVGIAGFSRTGWHVEYALSRTDIMFAAAITSDNIGSNYLETTLVPGSQVEELGAPPFGEGMEAWLEGSPAFSVERVQAPLRIQSESGGVTGLIAKWELFARLRQLNLPVEWFVLPNIEGGAHTIRNPGQVYASQMGAVDWWDFWLNDREDSDPAKVEQYVRWRRLRELRDAVLRAPRPPLLDWEATPRETGTPN